MGPGPWCCCPYNNPVHRRSTSLLSRRRTLHHARRNGQLKRSMATAGGLQIRRWLRRLTQDPDTSRSHLGYAGSRRSRSPPSWLQQMVACDRGCKNAIQYTLGTLQCCWDPGPLPSHALPSSQHTLYVFAVSFTSPLHVFVPQHSYWLLPVRQRSAPREEGKRTLLASSGTGRSQRLHGSPQLGGTLATPCTSQTGLTSAAAEAGSLSRRVAARLAGHGELRAADAFASSVAQSCATLRGMGARGMV